MRALVVGGGCRGLDLARALTAEGHAVRTVTRRPEARAAIEAAGAECFAGDPDVVGTLRYALDNVTILLWLLGSASGPADKVAALHGSRLRMMLSRTTDTTVRGVVYEAAGTVGPAVLAAGVEEMRHARRDERDPLRAARGRAARTAPRGSRRRAPRSTRCSLLADRRRRDVGRAGARPRRLLGPPVVQSEGDRDQRGDDGDEEQHHDDRPREARRRTRPALPDRLAVRRRHRGGAYR